MASKDEIKYSLQTNGFYDTLEKYSKVSDCINQEMVIFEKREK